MLSRPRFKDHFHIEVVRGEGVFVISERGHSVFEGDLFEYVAPLVTGTRTPDEIAEELPMFSPAEIYYALIVLERAGCLTDDPKVLPVGEATFWGVQDVTAENAARRLATMEVSVGSVGTLDPAPLRELLQALHIRVVSAEGALNIVLTDDYLRPELQRHNDQALREARPWAVIQPVGSQILIGPVFVPGRTGCWECLAARLRANRSIEMFVQRRQNRIDPFPTPRAETAAVRQVAYGIAASQIARWIAGSESASSEGAVLSVDVHTWQTDVHRLIRNPECPACGSPPSIAQQLARPLVLESRRKAFTEDGGHRAVTPRETLRRYEHQLSRLTGAVKMLERQFVAADDLIHVYTAGENLGAAHQSLGHLKRHLRSRSSGKGMTDEQSKASALCEALERHSGLYRGTEVRRRATLTALGDLGIHPNDCMRFSDSQYADRDAINAKGSRFDFVPLPFEEDREIDWTPVWSLTHQVHRYLPTEYCYYQYPAPAEQWRCVACSNGNAAGNNIEEAILQGFLELVERDSVAIWWYNRVPRPGVDVASFDEPYLTKLTAALRRRGIELSVLDLTSDLGIPVFAAVTRRIDRVPEQIMFGFGAHLDARIAVLRAVTEVNQMLAWVLRSEAQDEDIPAAFEDAELVSWLRTASIDNQRHLAPDSRTATRTASCYRAISSDDLKEDVLFCQRLVERHGMEMLVLDQTRPDVELPVVKVIVPGLRHFWARFAPGRLYDVPAALGWVPDRLREEELNPIACFL